MSMIFTSYPDKIHVLNDNTDMLQIIRDIASVQEDAFYAFNIGDMIQKHNNWKLKLPRVLSYYAVKCNDHKLVLEILAAMGVGFDCASKVEIKKVMELGVEPNRIIFANPAKLPSHIRFASSVNVDLMTFDNEAELYKIKTLFPSAKLVLRIRSDATEVQCPLGIKFGCNAVTEGPKLLQTARLLKLNVVGISFHVGSGCSEHAAYRRAIVAASSLFEVGHKLGFSMQLLDIGGGFPGEKSSDFDMVSDIINEALDEYFPVSSGVRIIAEPGRYYVASAFTLVTYIHSKREIFDVDTNEISNVMYYINDGIYGSFNAILYDHALPVPTPLNEMHSERMVRCSIWGPTCDGLDMVAENVVFPILSIGDWIMFENMGAYTFAAASTFNGFSVPKVIAIMDETTMLALKDIQTSSSEFDNLSVELRNPNFTETLPLQEFAEPELWCNNEDTQLFFTDIFKYEDEQAVYSN